MLWLLYTLFDFGSFNAYFCVHSRLYVCLPTAYIVLLWERSAHDKKGKNIFIHTYIKNKYVFVAPNNKHDFVGDDEKEEKKKKNPLSFPRTKRRNNEIRKPINNKRASTRDKNLFSFYCSVACPLSLSHTFDLAGSVARTHTVCGWLNSDESERTQLLRNQFGEDAHTKKDRRPTTLLDNGAISKSSHGNENWSLRTRWSSLFFRFVILYLHIDTTTGYIVYFHWMNGCFELVPLCVCVCVPFNAAEY